MKNTTIQEVDLTSNVIKETMDIDEFLKLEAVPHQRYTEGRAKTSKVKKMLGGYTRPEQLEVAIVELTEDCEYYGKTYNKGWRGIVNGNTRKMYWKQGLSKSRPSKVFATIYLLANMEEVRSCYNTFDSLDATEVKKEKLYGILCGVYKYDPQCSKIIKGEFLSGLNLACHFLSPDVFNQSTSKVDALPSQVGLFFDEIVAFDKNCQTPKSWDQSLLCAALMAFKKYGTNDQRFLECFNAIDARAMNTTTKERDGATHISYEWQTNERFPNKGTIWDKKDGMKEVVSFALYWIDKYMENQRLSQLGFNWKDTGKTFFKNFNSNGIVAALNTTNNVVPISNQKTSNG